MMMKKYVLDSYALIVYFRKQNGWETVRDLLFEAFQSGQRLQLTSINWGEVYYTRLKTGYEEKAEEAIHAIKNMPIDVVEETDTRLAKQAGKYKTLGGIAYADCFAAALTKKENATLVTGDKEFKPLEKEIKILWI